MGKADALGFRYKAKEAAVSVKAPRAANIDELKPIFVGAVQKLIGQRLEDLCNVERPKRNRRPAKTKVTRLGYCAFRRIH